MVAVQTVEVVERLEEVEVEGYRVWQKVVYEADGEVTADTLGCRWNCKLVEESIGS